MYLEKKRTNAKSSSVHFFYLGRIDNDFRSLTGYDLCCICVRVPMGVCSVCVCVCACVRACILLSRGYFSYLRSLVLNNKSENISLVLNKTKAKILALMLSQ